VFLCFLLAIKPEVVLYALQGPTVTYMGGHVIVFFAFFVPNSGFLICSTYFDKRSMIYLSTSLLNVET
jgi:hypothetical protein